MKRWMTFRLLITILFITICFLAFSTYAYSNWSKGKALANLVMQTGTEQRLDTTLYARFISNIDKSNGAEIRRYVTVLFVRDNDHQCVPLRVDLIREVWIIQDGKYFISQRAVTDYMIDGVPDNYFQRVLVETFDGGVVSVNEIPVDRNKWPAMLDEIVSEFFDIFCSRGQCTQEC